VRKNLKGLKKVRLAVNALKQALLLNPKNHFAHMLLSQFYRQAPSSISVGDKKKALAEAKLAVEMGPGYTINHLALAEALLDNGDKDDAVREFKTAQTLSAPADAIPETQADQETARKRLKELGVEAEAPAASSPALSTTPASSTACSDRQGAACTTP
jgi:tetratricopeptide (TPR) repeat protein